MWNIIFWPLLWAAYGHGYITQDGDSRTGTGCIATLGSRGFGGFGFTNYSAGLVRSGLTAGRGISQKSKF